ncbi:FAD-binding domain-containing protein [Atractiella rhizophila]|nr:FAD-binding domain-containing protein [Atractiella rhizophila]
MRPFRLPQQLLQLSRASKRWNSTVPPRKKQYKTLDAGDITFFRSVISNPDSNVITSLKPAAVDEAGWKEVEEVELGGYNEDWMGKYKGRSVAVVRPKRTEEVSKLLAYCYKQNIAVVPQGGNTGLVGGSVPVHDELVLNLSGMNTIRSFDDPI